MLIRRNIRSLNEGRYKPALAMFADEAELMFPGDNTWSRQYRAPQPGRAAFPTHKGRAEIETFLTRYVDYGIQMEVEDILVNGPPWNTRAAVRVHHWIPDPDGNDVYANRAVLFVRTSWGKIRNQEDYEDTERVSAFDATANTDSSATSSATRRLDI
ncbi:MAG: nuclear transport factor 2 family protein [Actinobacteria bacterium]|nr:nuclear transport factor 2 family protein [Actinomycetota bacterium]